MNGLISLLFHIQLNKVVSGPGIAGVIGCWGSRESEFDRTVHAL